MSNLSKSIFRRAEFCQKTSTYTKRLAKKVVKYILETDILNTGKRNRMTAAEIETLLKEVEEEVKKTKYFNKVVIDKKLIVRENMHK